MELSHDSSDSFEHTLDFWEYRAKFNLDFARLVAGIVPVIYPAAVVLEIFTQPDFIWPFLGIRVVVSVLSLVVLGLTYTRFAKKFAYVLGLTPILLAAIGMEIMILHLGGYSSPYYAGLNLCILGFCTAFYWRSHETVIGCVFVVGIWLVPTLLSSVALDLRVFVNNISFLLLTSTIAIASTARRARMMKREFETQARLARVSDELKEMDNVKTQFFANVSHELRTPLTLSIGPIDSLLAGPVDGAQKDHLEMLRRNQHRLLGLINDLLDFSKLEAGKVTLTFRRTDVGKRMRLLLKNIEGAMKDKGIVFVNAVPKDPVWLYVDPEKFDRVVMNLVSNAFKFTDSGGTISVEVSPSEKEVTFTVRDSGIGIPKDKLDTIFDRFSQVDASTTRKYTGTGIGLAMVKEYAELHSGEISVESVKGEGSVFVVRMRTGTEHIDASAISEEPSQDIFGKEVMTLDLQAEEEVTPDLLKAENSVSSLDVLSKAAETRIERARSELSGRPSVLVVDDTRDMRLYIKSLLSTDYDIYLARDGLEGLRLAQLLKPDLILSDIMMPKLSGEELYRKIREEPSPLGDTPVVLITARVDENLKLANLELGTNDYLFKPFNPAELFSRVRNLVNLRRSEIALRQAFHIVDEDLWAAGDYQQSLLPSLPEVPWLNAAVFFEPMDVSGGDFYDIFSRSESSVRVFVFDVTGHGVQAALRTATIRELYNVLKLNAENPSDVLNDLNEVFATRFRPKKRTGYSMTSTVSCAGICADISAHPKGGLHVRVASSTLEAPVFTRDGNTHEVDVHGVPLGSIEEYHYRDLDLELDFGDRLYFFTDGLSEQLNNEGAMFSQRGLMESLAKAHKVETLQGSLDEVISDWSEFRGDVALGDDVTVLSVQASAFSLEAPK